MEKRLPRVRLLAAVVLTLGIATAAAVLAPGTHGPPHADGSKAPRAVEAYITYYGWYDNTPPGCATAYSGCAGGTGTYRNPITFASYRKEFPLHAIVYYPTVEKYFVMGDECQECQADWTGKGPDGGPHLHHLDLWLGGEKGNEFDVINCEDGLTQGMPNGRPLLTPLILDPPSDLPVSSEPLFDSRTNHCFGGARTETSYGRYQNRKSGRCLSDRDDGSRSGTPAVLSPCDAGRAEDLAFDGAFFTVHNLCLATKGGKIGSRLEFDRCTGGPDEQWETGTNGTIAWIQYLRCITDVSGVLRLERCRAERANEWVFHPEHSS